MKHIQVIDGATNCTYSIFAATDEEFASAFPGEQNVGFPDEIRARLGEPRASEFFNALWTRPVDKKSVVGIHATLFYGLDGKKALYPDRRERGMDARAYSPAERKMLGIG